MNIEHRDLQGRTPFYWACHLGNLQIIQFLISKGADINAKSNLGRSPLGKTAYLGKWEVVNFLLQ